MKQKDNGYTPKMGKFYGMYKKNLTRAILKMEHCFQIFEEKT